MKKHNIIYVGIFPPPYGGVTRKNELLYGKLRQCFDIRRVDLERAKSNKMLLLGQALTIVMNRKCRFIVASSKKGMKYITALLYRFNRKALRRSILVVMGGTFSDIMKNNPDYAKMVREYQAVYVETASMKKKLIDIGFDNVKIYPNCREDIRVSEIKRTDPKNFKTIFFSYVTKVKGVDRILETARKLPDISFDIYGELDSEYEKEFFEECRELSNVLYKGVFKASNQETCELLHEYDMMLLPTRYENEGVPGTLVEAKLAALPSIVSDNCYNCEIILDGIEGIVLEENDASHLYEALNQLLSDSEYVDALKSGALESSKRYIIDEYLEDIVKELR